MLRRILGSDLAENERRRWRIIRRDSLTDLPGLPIEANCDTGHAVMREPILNPGGPAGTHHDTVYDLGAGGLIIIGRVLLLATMLGLGLSACARVQMFTSGDLANAKAIADTSGDKTGSQCWAGLAPIAAPVPNPSDQGIATLAERDRVLHQAVGGPCGAIIAPALLNLIQRAPALLPLAGIAGVAIP